MIKLKLDPIRTTVVVIDFQKGVVGNTTYLHSALAVVANTTRIWNSNSGGAA